MPILKYEMTPSQLSSKETRLPTFFNVDSAKVRFRFTSPYEYMRAFVHVCVIGDVVNFVVNTHTTTTTITTTTNPNDAKFETSFKP